jgi:hypothetical protein
MTPIRSFLAADRSPTIELVFENLPSRRTGLEEGQPAKMEQVGSSIIELNETERSASR